ncbi:uncharacterized protein LOC108916870 isoform X1 [Anoplophora glabripennis]|uniref:uncharacterized protein LOC108916870 isoform X1 n=1 Tax=Anoplophora glabripennis TaxID=217634 RepID=UPI000875328B|nr:uncharacterized protein LOC108916870 isoform X1 [Anoplophora glabripennis]
MRSAWLSLLLQFWLFIQIYSGRSSFRPKTVRIYQFKGICPGHEDIPVYYSDIEVVNINRTFRVSLKANIRSDINNDMKLWLFLSRCNSRDALDSCETYNTIKINHFCKILNGENMPWTDAVRKFSPPLRCPLKKGVYEFKNSTFDGSAFNRFPVLNWYWKVLVNIKDEITDELLQCATLEGQIAPI